LALNSSSRFEEINMGDSDSAAQDRQVEMWKVKKLIKSLQAARG
jgi:hypothetical protein